MRILFDGQFLIATHTPNICEPPMNCVPFQFNSSIMNETLLVPTARPKQAHTVRFRRIFIEIVARVPMAMVAKNTIQIQLYQY